MLLVLAHPLVHPGRHALVEILVRLGRRAARGRVRVLRVQLEELDVKLQPGLGRNLWRSTFFAVRELQE